MSNKYRAVLQVFMHDYTKYRKSLIKEKKAKGTEIYVVNSRFGRYRCSDKWTYSIDTFPLKEMTSMNRILGLHKLNKSQK